MEKEEAYAVECLVNLLYLIRLRAAAPADVLTFVDLAETPLETLIAAARRSAPPPRSSAPREFNAPIG